MARTKKAPENGAAVEEPTTVTQTTSPGDAAEPQPNGNGHGDKKKPLVSYRLSSDRTTSIEVAVWSNTFTNRETGEEYEQLSITVNRSYKDQNGSWCKGGSWRIHDLPCLLHLLHKAHSFALDRRTADSGIPF